MTTVTGSATADAPSEHEIDLAIGGMTCASCSSRVERKLNKLDGVRAQVNLVTEQAHVRFRDPIAPADLVAAVERTGYSASVLDAPEAADGRSDGRKSSVGIAATSTDQAAANDNAPAPDSPHAVPKRPSRWARLRRLFEAADLRRRLWVCAALTLPLVLIAMTPLGHGLGDTRPWVELALALPVATWGAWPFHRAAAINARHGASTMDTLVSLGVSAAFGWSLVATLTGQTGHLWYETAAVITTFLLAGRVAEARARREGRSALQSLLDLRRGDVTVLVPGHDGGTTHERVPVERLGVGDRFLVRPGEKVAADGVVLEGASAIDASLVTGESMPVEVGVGDQVVGGTINTVGLLVVQAQAVGADTVLAGITRLVEQAQTGKAPVQRLADRVSSVFVPVVLALSALTFIGWMLTGSPFTTALSSAVAVLVVACPCALGLATPTALLAGTGRGAQLGVLIKGPEILESTRRVDVVLLDKTGTVTTGRMRLVGITPAGRLTPTAALQAAAAVEVGSEHPVAQAIVTSARERNLALPPAANITAQPGSGVRGSIKGTQVTVGRPELFDKVPEQIAGPDPAGTTVYVGWGGVARAALTVADGVRPDSAHGIERLHELGLRTYLLTGDNAATAAGVARDIGIEAGDVFAGVRPDEKHEVVQRLRRQGHVVAMVGDGVNDAAALAEADLGIAMGSGTDIAMESADIVLMRPQVAAVADAIHLSRRTLRICLENLAWAFGYNVVALPLAAFGIISPMVAGIAMASSSVIVVLNSLRLRRVGHAPQDEAERPHDGADDRAAVPVG
ncbi:Cu+-exporting ATPase [Kineosphaera limosa]|uniref:Cation-transporting P-type ATPase B n=1 Tax=Kineosphaera limosa NBRC 100340 TaxID=1184609 RepID=K6XD08_9MICO|nr:heavy metal translocating P-type ATPase [Kineosphaera limosa]NYE01542.1 Cu+-exporting ATPase [Kineosphaera limosa]GAB96699.1 copper-transporting ATPase CopA [Kineosphaera limosa NBRC 100340]